MGTLRLSLVVEQMCLGLRNEAGQDLVEYGVLAALVSIVAIASITAFGQQAAVLWSKIASTVALVVP